MCASFDLLLVFPYFYRVAFRPRYNKRTRTPEEDYECYFGSGDCSVPTATATASATAAATTTDAGAQTDVYTAAATTAASAAPSSQQTELFGGLSQRGAAAVTAGVATVAALASFVVGVRVGNSRGHRKHGSFFFSRTT